MVYPKAKILFCTLFFKFNVELYCTYQFDSFKDYRKAYTGTLRHQTPNMIILILGILKCM